MTVRFLNMKYQVLTSVSIAFLAQLISAATVGPQLPEEELIRPELDLAVVVFDPNVDEYSAKLHEKMIWPQVRKTESIRFAHQLKRTIQNRNLFERVFVAPTTRVSADLYLTGTIRKSTPDVLEISWALTDARGVKWFGKGKRVKHRVESGWHERFNQTGRDPFQRVWDIVSQTIEKRLQSFLAENEKFIDRQMVRISPGQTPRLSEVQHIALTRDLAMARVLAPTIYSESLVKNRRDQWRIASIPDPKTEDWLRVEAFARKDQDITDLFDVQYTNFINEIGPIYEIWQDDLYEFSKDARVGARRTRILQIVGGVLAIMGLSIAGDEDPPESALDEDYISNSEAGAEISAIGVGILIASLFTGHRKDQNLDILNEKSSAFDHEFSPMNIKIQDNTMKLQGRISDQFTVWRQTLKELYEDRELSAHEIILSAN